MEWRKIEFRGMEAIVFDGRPEDFPKGYTYFQIRHHSEDWDDPRTIEGHVIVNYWGTIGLKDFYLKLTHKERDLIRGRD